jgi:pimeloyl-ACP methyl ester carboxylesterase
MSAAHATPTVVLLHGLARTPHSMSKMESELKAAGFATCNIRYPSTRHAIETLTREYVQPAVEDCLERAGANSASFVTHSMGGIIVRQLRHTAPHLSVDRVVMLGPPNQGSELADRMRACPLYRWINGPAGQQLGTEATSVPNRLGPADFQLGVIAGNRPVLEPFKHYIDGPSDGKVSVERSKLAGTHAHLILPVTHATMMRHEVVIKQTIAFLRDGAFGNDPGESSRLHALHQRSRSDPRLARR